MNLGECNRPTKRRGYDVHLFSIFPFVFFLFNLGDYSNLVSLNKFMYPVRDRCPMASGQE